MVKNSSKGEEAKSPVEKMRRKTNLPRDWQGLIRLPWLENFYETLYASNERGIYIPYTVVFQYRRIYAAYFTDSDGYVQKIDKIADLGPEQVLEGLQDTSLQPKGNVGCRAVYTYAQKNESESYGLSEGTNDLCVEYFDDPSTTHFLTYRSKENNGILQQFMEPPTSGVCSIRAYWTPHYCNLDARMNIHRADMRSVAMGQRLVTHEGELHHSQPFPMSSRVKIRVNKVIDRIVKFITDCLPPNVRIQLMIINLKMGANGKIWFLYCNSLKLFDVSADAGSFGRDSESIRPSDSLLVEATVPPPGVRGSKKRKGLVCPSTDMRLGPFDTYRVPAWQCIIHFLWHGPKQAWALLGRTPPHIPLEFGTDPGMKPDALKFLVTMDLRTPPIGRPFMWNAEIGEKDFKIREPSRWSQECKDAHRSLERLLDNAVLEDPELRVAYQHFEATIVWLIGQEVENLSQENFKQQRIRPAFLNANLHCGERAMYVYATTLEAVLEEERQALIRPVFQDTAAHTQLMASTLKDPAAHRGIPRKGDVLRPAKKGSLTERGRERSPMMDRGMVGGGALTERGTARRSLPGLVPPFMAAGGHEESPLKSGVTRLAGSSVAKRLMAELVRTRVGPGFPQGPGHDLPLPSTGILTRSGSMTRTASKVSMVSQESAGRKGSSTNQTPLRALKSGGGFSIKKNRGKTSGGGPALPSVIVTPELIAQMTDLLTPRN